MSRVKDLAGQCFGKLNVIRRGYDCVYSDKRKKISWVCTCSCDPSKEITAFSIYLLNGDKRSCGCLKKEVLLERNYKHGLMDSVIYSVWSNMRRRCMDCNNPQYKDYGGRGISVSDSWGSFENFYNDMHPTHYKGATLDRVDVNLGYCIENCKWSGRTEQAYNTRKRLTNTSGRTGVKLTSGGKWSADIAKKGKRYYLGSFINIEDAIQARSEAELELYGYNKE